MSAELSVIERMAHDLHRRFMGGILTEAEIELEWPRRRKRYVAGMVEAIVVLDGITGRLGAGE